MTGTRGAARRRFLKKGEAAARMTLWAYRGSSEKRKLEEDGGSPATCVLSVSKISDVYADVVVKFEGTREV